MNEQNKILLDIFVNALNICVNDNSRNNGHPMKKVFLSYASEDLDQAIALHKALRDRGFIVYIDKDFMKPGLWKEQIEEAIYKSDVFMVCLSKIAIEKINNSVGFQKSEIQLANDIVRKGDANKLVIIPVRLEPCERGDHRLSAFQQYDLFENWDKVVSAIVEAIGRDDDSKKAIEDKINYFFSIRDYKQALFWLNDIVREVGSNSDVIYYQALCHYNLNEMKEAEYLINSIIQKECREEYVISLGMILIKNRKYKDAFDLLKELAKKNDHGKSILRNAILGMDERCKRNVSVVMNRACSTYLSHKHECFDGFSGESMDHHGDAYCRPGNYKPVAEHNINDIVFPDDKLLWICSLHQPQVVVSNIVGVVKDVNIAHGGYVGPNDALLVLTTVIKGEDECSEDYYCKEYDFQK